MSDDIKPLNTVEASKPLWDKWHYKLSPHTLETYRSRGGGPAHFYIGISALYWPADLEAWVLSRMTPKVGSASEGRQIRLARRNLIQGESNKFKTNLSKSKTIKTITDDSKLDKS
jgi:hypothetical protein